MKIIIQKSKKAIFIIFTFSAIMTMLILACQREFRQGISQKSKLVQAKNWFNKKYNELLQISSEGKLVNGTQYPDWRFIKVYNFSTLEIIEAPILASNRKIYTIQGEDIHPNAGVSVSKLLIARNRNGGFRESVMTIIPQKEFLLSNNRLDHISLNNIPRDFNGLILFHDWEGKYLNGYIIVAGKATEKLKESTRASANNNLVVAFEHIVNIHCQGCDLLVNQVSDQYYSWVCPDDNLAMNPCGNLELVSYPNDCGAEPNPFNCPCIGNSIVWDMCGFTGGGDGGYGGDFDPNQAPNITISDSLRDSFPCLYHLLKDSLPNLNREAQMELFSNFNVSERINLKFDIDWSLDSTSNTDAYTDYTASNYDGYRFNGVIKFNPYYIRSGSKEYTVSTIVHEAIHAYIEYMFDAYTRNVPGIDSAYLAAHFPLHWNYFKQNPVGENLQHRLMAQHYINTIQNITKIFYNPNADTATINRVSRALAWSGLGKTISWKNLSDTCDIKAIFWTARIIHLDVSTRSFGNSCRTYNLHYKDSLKLSQPCQ